MVKRGWLRRGTWAIAVGLAGAMAAVGVAAPGCNSGGGGPPVGIVDAAMGADAGDGATGGGDLSRALDAGGGLQLGDGGAPADLQKPPVDLAHPGDLAQGNACTTLDPGIAPAVTIQQVAQDPPAPSGGTVVDGTYVLTDATQYNGPNGQTGPLMGGVHEVIRMKGGGFEYATRIDGMGGDQGGSGTFTVGSGMFVVTTACPKADPPSSTPYSATMNVLRIHAPIGKQTLVFTFTRM